MILSIGNLGWTQLSSWNWLLSTRKKMYWELKRYCQIQPLCRTAQAYPRKQRGTFFWASKWKRERTEHWASCFSLTSRLSPAYSLGSKKVSTVRAEVCVV